MNIGDMKYTFTDNAGIEHTVEIPSQVLREARKNGLTNKQAIQRYLYNSNYDVVEPEVNTMNNEVKKKRSRKPNEKKRELISLLENMLVDEYGVAEVVNPERMVRLTLDDITYEFTLVQKRK